MTSKEKLYYLLTEYQKGKYDTNTFCDQFTIIYDTEVEYDTLSKVENELFNELSIITARFSPYEEDLKIPSVYYSEQEVKSKVEEVIVKLLK
ncbi:MAG: colicin immunity domain-containing protein [Clostridiales bacterium]|nr:colicin immunity domain-containing protein [Clostridiales bacterium]